MPSPGSQPIRGAAAAVALVAALVLAGCAGDGNGNGNGDPTGEAVQNGNGNGNGTTTAEAAGPDPVAAAATRTIQSGSARVAYDATFDGPEGAYSFDAEGEVDYDGYRGRLVYDLSELPGSGGDEVEVRLDGGVVYVRFPPGSADISLPEGKEWVRIGPGAEEETAEEQPAPAGGLAVGGIQQDPTQFLRYLASGSSDVLREGTEEVRGVSTTIYTALIDLDRVVEEGGDELGRDDEQRSAARRSAEQLKDQLGIPTVSVTANVDDDGLIRRLLLSFELAAASGTQPVTALTTTEFYDFGVDVDVEAPPEALVIDAADVQ